MASTPPQDTWARVGATIRTYREMRGLTPDQLASNVGISRPYLSNIEAGRKRLTPVMLAKLAEALHVAQHAILAGESPEVAA